MYISNDFIDAIPLNSISITNPGYLGNIKKKLKQKHAVLLKCTAEEPVFLIDYSFRRARTDTKG
jgi:hypothetical protein